MESSFELQGGASVLRLRGEIDLHASPQLREVLLKASGEGKTPLLVDFTGVEYIDSSGLATLIEYLRGGNGQKRQLALFGLQSRVRMVFELVRLHELFQLCASEADARKALGLAPAVGC